MYSRLLILSFILCANSLFAQSSKKNEKVQRILNVSGDSQNGKPQILNATRTSLPISGNEDKRSQIKSREELLNWIFSASPIAGGTATSPTLQSRSISNTKPNPSNVKLASEQPMEERKIEVSKDILKINNQGK